MKCGLLHGLAFAWLAGACETCALFIVGGNATTSRSSRFILEASCSHVEWDLRSSGDNLATASVAHDPRYLVLPPYTLEASTTYTARASSGNSSAAVQVVVGRGDVVAVIEGGTRTAPRNSTVLVSAAASYDEDNSSDLAFSWNCSWCEGDLTREVVEVRVPSTLGVVLNLSVTVVAADGRQSTADASLASVDGSEPSVAVATERAVLANSDRVVIDGIIVADANVSSSWEVVDGDVDLETAARTDLRADGFVVGERSHPLVLAAFSLVGGDSYAFRLGAGAVAFAELAVRVTVPPSAGALTVAPTNGTALDTEFRLETSMWASEHLPLQYAFVTSTSVLHPSSRSDVASVILRAGRVAVSSIATDALGGQGSASVTVDVEAFDGDVLIRTLELLECADDDTVYQVAVAASAPNTSLLDVLVAAVQNASMPLRYDDAELVEQAATALASVASHASALSAAAAEATLETVASLARVAVQVGATNATAHALASSLSSILETSYRAQADKFLAAVDDICRALLVGTVAGEEASLVATTHVSASAQRLRNNGTSNEDYDRFLEVPGADASAAVEANLGGERSSVYDAWLSELALTPFASDSLSDTDATSEVLRWGMAAITNTSASNTDVQLDIDGPAALRTVPVALSCGCEDYSEVNYTCPDGTVFVAECDGLPGIWNVTCPELSVSCAARVSADHDWFTYCTPMPTDDPNVTRCICPVNTEFRASVRTQLSASSVRSMYARNFESSPDIGRALLMFITLGILVAMCAALAAYGYFLDRRDENMALTATKVGARTRHDVVLGNEQFARFKHELCIHHTVLNVLYVYSRDLSRPIRALNLFAELLTFAFALAVEQNIEYPDSPGCGQHDDRDDCESVVEVSWLNKNAFPCEWNSCSDTCYSRGPKSSASTTPAHYLSLLFVFAVVEILLALYNFIFVKYVLAPSPIVPPERVYKWDGRAKDDEEDDDEDTDVRAEADTDDDEDEIPKAPEPTSEEVALAVLAQIAELDAIATAAAARSDASHVTTFVRDLRGALARRWGVSEMFTRFKANVATVLAEQKQLAKEWQAELRALRATSTNDAVYLDAASKRLFEYQHVARMQSMERRVASLIVERTEYRVDVPRETPSVWIYVAAWLTIVAMLAFFAYYLIATASTIGRRKSRLWLINMVVAFVLVFGIAEPLTIFVFAAWFPELVRERLETDRPGDARPFPYARSTPYSVSMLLELEPDLKTTVAGRAIMTSDDSRTPEQKLDALVDDMPDIYWYELYAPTALRRAALFAVGVFVSLPAGSQEVVFHELVGLTPILTASVVASLPNIDSIAATALIVFAAGLFIFACVCILQAAYTATRTHTPRRERSLRTLSSRSLQSLRPSSGSVTPLCIA